MNRVTLSSRCRLVVPRALRERLRLRPGMKLVLLEKSGVLYLVPERPLRGIAKGASVRRLREKRDRF